jgi:6-phosphogluconate dehydrogenase
LILDLFDNETRIANIEFDENTGFIIPSLIPNDIKDFLTIINAIKRVNILVSTGEEGDKMASELKTVSMDEDGFIDAVNLRMPGSYYFKINKED